MYGWRVTKYDPRFRDEAGCYLRDEWIGAAQIGTEHVDGVLTLGEYLRVESLYVAAVSRFWEACGSPPLQIQALEVGAPFGLPSEDNSLDDVGFDDWQPVNGEYVPKARVDAVVRWCLRDFGWCQLVAERFYVHFGHDYYLYIGAEGLAHDARRQIAADGLFVEMCDSPYQRGAPTALMVLAFRIGDPRLDHEFALSDLPASAIGDLWPEVVPLVGYRTRPIDADLAARIRRYSDVAFDFECFTYLLDSDA